MKNRSEYSRERRSFAQRVQDLIMRKSAALQRRVYSSLLPVIASLDVDSGRLVFNLRNVQQIGAIRKIVTTIMTEEGSGLGRWMGKRMIEMLSLNRLYFKSFLPDPLESVEDRVRERTLLRLGYEAQSGNLITGGYLHSIAQDTRVAQAVGASINRSLAARMGLSQFQRDFKDLFVNPSGLGLVEAHFYTNTFDLFQQYDRAISLDYADELGLNYAVYSGTFKNNTRSFCRARQGKVFSREEIESWRNLSFQGKPKIYNPATDLGGYNCRHSLDWISDELAERWRNE